MRAPITLVALLAAVCVAGAQPSEQKDATLTVELRTLLGGALPEVNLSVRSKNGVLVFSEKAKDETRIRLPFGEYTVTAEAKFLQTVSRRVVVSRPDCFLVLATEMARFVMDMPNNPVAISIQTAPAASCRAEGKLWAKLVAIYGDYSAEQPIGPNGFALFEPVAVGKYVLFVVDGENLRATTPVTTKGKVTTVTVQLARCE